VAGVREGTSALRTATVAAGAKQREAAAPPETNSARIGSPGVAAPSPLATARRRSTWEVGVFLYGLAFAHDRDYVGAEAGYKLPTPQACRDLCLKHAACTAWKFNGSDYPNTDLQRVCYLFEGTPIRIDSDRMGIVAGVIEAAP
jgi:hypothetical protein